MKIWQTIRKVGAIVLTMALFAQGAGAVEFDVNNTGDGDDFSAGDGICETAEDNGICTLRAAIHETNDLAGADTIYMETNTADPDNLRLFSELPDITETVEIDGNGVGDGKINVVNSNAIASTIFDVTGAAASGTSIHDFAGLTWALQTAINVDLASGVHIENNVIYGNLKGVNVQNAENVVISGNTISDNTTNGVVITGSDGAVIDDNIIGSTGSAPFRSGNHTDGLLLSNSDAVTISNNEISGNTGYGVWILNGVTNPSIYGNVIGLHGDTDLVPQAPNGGSGIVIDSIGDGETLVIGDSAQDPNIISTNGSMESYAQIQIGASVSAGSLKIQNNYLGTDVDGNYLSWTNLGPAIDVSSSAALDSLVIGSDTNDPDEGNIISANNSVQTVISVDGDVDTLIVTENRIGVGLDNNAEIFGYSNTMGLEVGGAIGLSLDIINNIFGGSSEESIYIGVAAETPVDLPIVIQGNYIGISSDGRTDLNSSGVWINVGDVTFGGANDLLASDGAEIGEGNVLSFTEPTLSFFDSFCAGLCLSNSVSAAYIYGNVFGLSRGVVTGEYDTNAPISGSDITLNSIAAATLEIGAKPELEEDPSQRRNIISGFDINYLDEVPQDKILISNMCDADAEFGDGNYCANDFQMASVEIVNNYIGLSFSGEEVDYGEIPDDARNSDSGIDIWDGDVVSIGYTGIGDYDENGRNVIGGIPRSGIEIFNTINDRDVPGAVNVLGNYIGVNADGDTAVPNLYGIEHNGGNAYIGYFPNDVSIYAPNVISGNMAAGVSVQNTDRDVAYLTGIAGNYIGTSADGLSAISNGGDPFNGDTFVGGIVIADDSADTDIVIGGSDPEDRNIISGNYYAGINVQGIDGLSILGNYIGLNLEGDDSIPNQQLSQEIIDATPGLSVDVNGSGIIFMDTGMSGDDGYQTEISGVLVQGNYISGNEGNGISLIHQPAGNDPVIGGLGQNWNEEEGAGIVGNFIGVAGDGVTAMVNGPGLDTPEVYFGIFLDDGATDVEYNSILNFDPQDNVINGGIYLDYVDPLPSEEFLSLAVDTIYADNTWSMEGLWDGLIYNLFHIVGYYGAGANPDPTSEDYVVPDFCRPTSACVVGSVCGNGSVEDGEECDDGNVEDDDGCSATCQEEGGGGGTLIISPPITPPDNPPPGDNGDDEEDIQEEEPIQEPEVVVEDAVSTVEDKIVDLIVGTETGVETQTIAEVTTERTTEQTTEISTEEETPLPAPTEISEVDTDAVYSNSTYASQALALIVSGSADKANEELRQVYGLEKIQENQTEQEVQKAEKELGDAVVFGKKPGEVVTVPRISNLHGTVGSNPVILALSQPNEEITIELSKIVPTTKTKKKQSTPVITITGTTDDEGKAVLNTLLSDGEYSATIYTTRNGNKITGKTIKFTVDQTVDQEFKIQDLTIIEENAHEPYFGETGELVTFLLNYLEKFDPRFIAQDYIDYARTGGTVYVVEGRVDTLDNQNKMVYLAYQSVTFGSAVISDASQKGSFKMIIPKGLGKGQHKLTAYAYDPKQAKSTSQKKISFQIQK